MIKKNMKRYANQKKFTPNTKAHTNQWLRGSLIL